MSRAIDEEISKAMRQLPDVRRWIQDTISLHANLARPLHAFGLQRLDQCFEAAFLQRVRVFVVERVPAIPW